MKSNSNLSKAIAQAVVDQATKPSPKKSAKKMPAAPLGGNAGAPTPPMGTGPTDAV